MNFSPALLTLGLALTLGAAAPSHADAQAPTVKLLDAGKGSKAPLRLSAKAGSKATTTMTMSMQATATFGDQSMPPQVVPPITMIMDTEVSEVKDDSFTMSFKYTGVEIGTVAGAPEGAAAAMKEMVGELIGLEGHTTVTSRGFVTDGSFAPKEGASAQVQEIAANLEKSMSQLSAPLPAEPVGIGAKWEVKSSLDSGGIKLAQSAIYTLTAREGNTASMDVVITQSAKDQTISTPQGDAKLVSMSTDGSGKTTLDLGMILPIKGTSDAKVAMKMAMDMNGQAIEMDMVTEMGVVLGSEVRP